MRNEELGMRNVSVSSEQLVGSSGRRIQFLALLSVICFLLFGCENVFERPKGGKGGGKGVFFAFG